MVLTNLTLPKVRIILTLTIRIRATLLEMIVKISPTIVLVRIISVLDVAVTILVLGNFVPEPLATVILTATLATCRSCSLLLTISRRLATTSLL